MTALALLAAVGSALAFGVAAVLQGVATRHTADTGHLDPGLLVRLARQPLFLVALVLNLAGFGLHVTALQELPLFLVQAVIAASVAVTAVLSVRVFRVPLSGLQWAAVATACVGLALLTPSAETGEASAPDSGERLGLLAVNPACSAPETSASGWSPCRPGCCRRSPRPRCCASRWPTCWWPPAASPSCSTPPPCSGAA